MQEFTKFNVSFYIENDEDFMFLFCIESDDFDINTQCVSELISNLIKKTNSQKKIIDYNNKKFFLSLKESENSEFYIHNYELRENEKTTNLPKYNSLCFSPSLILNNLTSKQICLVVKNRNALNLIEK